MGPWEEASRGVLFRQEVLWDAIEADGAELRERRVRAARLGLAERRGNHRRADERRPGSRRHPLARTWHNQTLSTTLEVTGGKPVTIRVHARAVRPEGFREMRRITRKDTPAHQAARRFLRGANLGNGLEVPPGQNWGAPLHRGGPPSHPGRGIRPRADPDRLASLRGPRSRIPALARDLQEGRRPGRLRRFEEGLNVLINIHHFDEFTSNPAGVVAQVLRHLAADRRALCQGPRGSRVRAPQRAQGRGDHRDG